MRMVYHWCIVPMCNSTSVQTPEKTFINVPKASKIRKLWIKAVRHDPKDFAESSVLFVCGDHFNLEEDMSNYMEWKMMGMGLKNIMKKGVVPHIFHCQKDMKRSFIATDRSAIVKRQRRKFIEEAVSIPSISTAVSAAVEIVNVTKHDDISPTVDVPSNQNAKKTVGIQVNIKPHYRSQYIQCNIKTPVMCQSSSPIKKQLLDAALSPIHPPRETVGVRKTPLQLTSSESQSTSTSQYESSPGTSKISGSSEIEGAFAKEQLAGSSSKHTFHIIERNPRRYLGIPKDTMFIIRELQQFTGLDITSIYLTIKKIRLDQTFAELGDDFVMSESNASRIFAKSVVKIGNALSDLIVWPSAEKIKRLLPITFRARYAKVQSIIDCLEIEIQKPEDAVNQALTWSEYKKCNTMKYLVSSTPDGIVNFISIGFGGRTSDAVIVEECGFLEKLTPGLHVMADRGFKHIDQLLIQQKCLLVRPPSVSSGQKLSKGEVLETKRIASLRIHIERVIRRIREFKMLKPHSCVHLKLVPYMDIVLKIVCGLINLQGPLIIGNK